MALLVVAGIAFFLFTREKAVALAFGFEEGQTNQFRMTMAMDGQLIAPGQGLEQPLTMEVAASVSWRVVEVDEKGIATIEMSMDEVSGTVNGMAQPESLEGTKTQFRMAPDGRVLTAGDLSLASSANGQTFPGFDQVAAILPDHAVSPGDAWSKEFTQAFPFGQDELRYTTTNRFDRYEDVEGVRTAVITSRMTSPLDMTFELRRMLEVLGQSAAEAGLPPGSNPRIVYEGEATTNMTSWIDPEARELVKGRSSGTFDMTLRFKGFPAEQIPPGAEVTFTGTASMELARLQTARL
jgi:hypothetical protein